MCHPYNQRLYCALLTFFRGRIHYSASDFLPRVLSNAALGDSYDPTKTAFQQAVGTRLSLFDWMQQKVLASDTDWRPVQARRHPAEDDAHGSSGKSNPNLTPSEEIVRRPEVALFNLAMAGLGRGTEQYSVYEFPWKSVGSGTVVDVGGGIGKFALEFPSIRVGYVTNGTQLGSFCMQLHSIYPKLKFVIQDREFMVQQAVSSWKEKYPSAVSDGSVKLVVHDFFEKNPVVGAEVYWLRHIM